MDLIAIVPSRGRPQAAVELGRAFKETCTARTGLVFAVDADDPMVGEYDRGLVPGDSIIVCDAPSTMVRALNHAAVTVTTSTAPKAPFAVAFLGDDHRPRTKGWDARYLGALRELGTGIVYGNDLVQGERIPTQCAMTSDIIRTLGYMAPPDLTHLYVDNAWLALGRHIGIAYLPDVIVQHLHPVAGTAPWDEGYARVNDPAMYARDKAAYERWLRESLPAEASRLRRAAVS